MKEETAVAHEDAKSERRVLLALFWAFVTIVPGGLVVLGIQLGSLNTSVSVLTTQMATVNEQLTRIVQEDIAQVTEKISAVATDVDRIKTKGILPITESRLANVEAAVKDVGQQITTNHATVLMEVESLRRMCLDNRESADATSGTDN